MENGDAGIYLTGNGPVTVQWNSIMANGNGILLTGTQISGADINQNRISANDESGIQIDAQNHYNLDISYNNISSNGKGFYISTLVSTQVTSNSISYNNFGILYSLGSHTANYNDIYANEMGMDVELDANVNAEHNYWGDESGPYHEKLNPAGQGNPVGGNGENLDFVFFLTKSIGIINVRPTAVLVTDKIMIRPNEEVMFFATNSFDDDGRVDRYFFDFGNGQNSSWTALSAISYTYTSYTPPVENFNVILTVLDDYGTLSDSVIVVITVQDLPPLQISLSISNSTIHEGEQVSILAHVTSGVNDVENATVTLLSVVGGSFTQSSGLTNTTGYFATAFTAPDIVEKTFIRIVARASMTGYADDAAHQYLEVSPFISVQISANPDIVKSEGISQIVIYVRSNDEPVVNATLTVSSSIGSLSSETGLTGPTGAFSLMFTAPQTETILNAIVTTTATKAGYREGTGQTTLVVEPKILNVQIETQPNATISEARLNVTVHVDYETIPIGGANVTVMADDGNFSITSKLTDSNGDAKFSFTAPPVNAQSNITITARATKTGYAAAQNQIEVEVNPRTFIIVITAPTVESEQSADIRIQVKCAEDAKPVLDANVTVVSDIGSFSGSTKVTDSSGVCSFIFTAPYTVTQIPATITVNVTRNGYANGGNQTEIAVTPAVGAQSEGGWPITTILLILIPIIIIVVIVVLVKSKVISVSSKEEEEET
jgi:hypothetical protein